ncbi:MAG: IPT/TIG domain-containing protein [Treponema sp.]|uniref:transglutaminase domain-containing protein n=1 Tax=Treponema sp. TaxID=166 RepID=UPI0025D6E666|nr:transglutaminase domain-containing protein [Treponema sp.]MBQ8678931.1 IPT/TIG domain-containing protein [Treponema sp.]
MNFKNTIFLLFRKYSFFRVLFYVFVIALALGVVSVATVKSKRIPVISSVIPVVGSPGDTMVIRGSNFGSTRGTNFVEIGGSRITASGYITWTDTLIKLTIPSNVQDGLVIVTTQSGKSKPGFFANEAGIPVAVKQDKKTSEPVITQITPASGSYGTLITIMGSGFGTSRGESKVYFTANVDESSLSSALGSGQGEVTADFDFSVLSASESDYDYEYWSDSEIRVRIPDGATTGGVYVKTDKGKSNPINEEIKLAAGSKNYHTRKTYIIQLNADIDSIDTKKGTAITLRVPRPVVTSRQPMVELTECSPEPVISDYKNTVIHQLELQKASSKSGKIRFSHNFVVSSYAVKSEINAKAVKPYSPTVKSRIFFKNATAADSLIQCTNEDVITLAKEIIGKETNPYIQAKLIYDYLLRNYTLRDSLRKSDASPLDLLKSKKGDAYDLAIFYTTLLRAAGIPAEPVAGILVDSEMKNQAHWWTEFYVEGFAWIPVDVALGMELPYKAFRPVENSAEFYFGNIDSQHIAFSKGWNEIKQTISQNSKIVYRPKTYALQSIWEESSEGDVNYSSLWNDPIVLGLY